MKNKTILLITTFIIVLFLLFGCNTKTTDGSIKPEPVLDGAQLLEQRCTECHSLRRVERSAITIDEWRQVVDAMIVEGAVLLPEEKEILISYLAEMYPAP